MARMKKIEAAALNIKIHPHPTIRYVDMFNHLYSLSNHVKIWDKYYGTIGWIKPLDEKKPEKGLEGEIYKYLNIDPTQQWFDKKEKGNDQNR